MTEKIGGENGVTPSGEAHADLLKHPARVGTVAVRHVHPGADPETISIGGTLLKTTKTLFNRGHFS